MVTQMTIDDWPHHSEHLVNDDKMAELTVGLIAALVVFISIVAMIVGLSSM